MSNKKYFLKILNVYLLFLIGFSACSDGTSSGADNNTDKIPPKIISALIDNNALGHIIITFDEPVNIDSPDGFLFNIMSKNSHGLTGSVEGSGTFAITIIIGIIGWDHYASDTITLSYDGTGNIRDLSGNRLAAVYGINVINDNSKLHLDAASLTTSREYNEGMYLERFDIVLRFNESIANISADGFTVFINGLPNQPVLSYYWSDIFLIIFTIDTYIASEDAVTIKYNEDAGTIIASDGLPLSSFGPLMVSNYLSPHVTPPQFKSAIVKDQAPSDVIVKFDEAVRLSDAAGFIINVNGSLFTQASGIKNVSGSGTSWITFSIDTTVLEGDLVLVEYISTAGGDVRDIYGNHLASFTAQDVLNTIGPPRLVSAEINKDDINRILLTFNENLDWAPYISQFTITINNVTVSIFDFGVSVFYDNVVLIIDDPILYNDTITVQYNGDNGSITDTIGNPLASFGPIEVTNNVPQN